MLREWRIITRNNDGSQSDVLVWARYKWQAASMAFKKIEDRGVTVTEIIKIVDLWGGN